MSLRRPDHNNLHRMFVDVTTSLMVAGEPPMGISRVEGEIARRLLARAELNAIPVVFDGAGNLLALGPAEAARIFERRPEPGTIRLRAKPAAMPDAAPRPGLKQRARTQLRRTARNSLARLPDPVREDVRAILIHSRQILRTTVYRPEDFPDGRTPLTLAEQILPKLRVVVHPGPGDVLWTAGLYSNFVPLRAIAELRRATGMRVAATCYDLIRVSHPEFNPPSMADELFVGDAAALLDAADVILAISEATHAELRAFAERAGRSLPDVVVLQLGSDVAGHDRGGVALPAGFPPQSFALAVGTVEPRKNYGILVRVWERLVADPNFRLDLVIVGRAGFEAGTSVAEIERSSLFGERIFWVEQCPDELLLRLYQSCHVVLCPSFAEGWGLPVAEALAMGRTAIVSNRGALPEVAQGRASLLDPDDEPAWSAAIANAAAAPPRNVVPPQMPTWDAAAVHVAQTLMMPSR